LGQSASIRPWLLQLWHGCFNQVESVHGRLNRQRVKEIAMKWQYTDQVVYQQDHALRQDSNQPVLSKGLDGFRIPVR
jgi:hypothetical protein